MSPASHRWHVADPSVLESRHWPGNDEHLVFNSASGDLHLLNAAATAILELLSTRPATADELAVLLTTADRGQIEAALLVLDRLGLIDSYPS